MVCVNFGLNENYEKLSFAERLLHNTRQHKKVKNSIFDRNKNYDYVCDEIKQIKNKKDLNDFFEQEQENYKLLIKEKTKRKSQMKNHLMESLIGFSFSDYEKYGAEKLKKVTLNYIKTLEQQYKIKIYNVSFHFDEGHIDENRKEIKNIHCHFIHSNINHETGKSFTRNIYMKGEKNDYSFIQQDFKNFIVENLDKDYDIQTKKEKRKHLDYKTFKQIKQNEQKEILYYKKQIKNIKDKAISELKKQQEQLQQKSNEIVYLKKEITKKDKEIFDLKEKLKHKTTQSQQHQIQRKIQNLEKSQNAEMGL